MATPAKVIEVKRDGPKLITHDEDGKLKYPYTVCDGCKHYALIDRHYPYCAAQKADPNREFPHPKFGAHTSNSGMPNSTCPHPYTGRPRTTKQVLDAVMAKDSGWFEECPGENAWYFKKKNWLMTYSWVGRGVTFIRLKKAKGV